VATALKVASCATASSETSGMVWDASGTVRNHFIGDRTGPSGTLVERPSSVGFWSIFGHTESRLKGPAFGRVLDEFGWGSVYFCIRDTFSWFSV